MHLVIHQHVGLRAFVGDVFRVRSVKPMRCTRGVSIQHVSVDGMHACLKLYLTIKQEDSFKASFVIKGEYLDFSKLKNTSCHFCPVHPP